jgi:hypothetical protein
MRLPTTGARAASANSTLPRVDASPPLIETQRAQVALALSIYEASNGKHVTASELLGPGPTCCACDGGQMLPFRQLAPRYVDRSWVALPRRPPARVGEKRREWL